MAIGVECSCGRRLQAADDQAGLKMRCPACRALLVVPDEAEEAGSYGVEQARKCPGCKREWPLDAVVCIDCGYNFETRRKLRTRYRIAERVLDVGIVALGCYTRYRVFRNEHGKPSLSVTRKLFFLSLGSAVYDLGAYRSILTDFSAGNDDAPDVFYLELDGPGKRAVRIFNNSNEEKMKELIDLVAGAGRLEIKRK